MHFLFEINIFQIPTTSKSLDHFLKNKFLDSLVKQISPKESSPWPMPARNGIQFGLAPSIKRDALLV